MGKPHFICISGKARSGKDTSAKLLKSCLDDKGYSTIIVHYADLLKFMCKTYFGWDGKKDDAGRSLLQHIGTDRVRRDNPNYWVDFVIQTVLMFEEKWDFVIVADARFENEIERVKEAGFGVTHVRVVRPEFDSDLSDEQKSHVSETAMNDVKPDRWIFNNDMSGLEEDVKKLAVHAIWKKFRE